MKQSSSVMLSVTLPSSQILLYYGKPHLHVLYFGYGLKIFKGSNRKKNNKNITMTELYARPVQPKSQAWRYLG